MGRAFAASLWPLVSSLAPPCDERHLSKRRRLFKEGSPRRRGRRAFCIGRPQDRVTNPSGNSGAVLLLVPAGVGTPASWASQRAAIVPSARRREPPIIVRTGNFCYG